MKTIQALQEDVYDATFDYRNGSPHLKHWSLFDRLVGLLRQEIDRLANAGMPLTVLDIGAGHGSYTEPALSFGCQVTATEMSRSSLARMDQRFRHNPNFRGVFDSDGSLRSLGDRQFSVVLCSSMLHHVPDYLTFLTRDALAHVAPGGTLLSIQDPMWFPGLGRSDLALQRLGYYSWRAIQGEYGRALRTGLRRVRGVYDESCPWDMVEYHATRKGVDQEAIRRTLDPHFRDVEVLPYWSTQSNVFQAVGERLKRENTFAFRARGHLGGTTDAAAERARELVADLPGH